MISKLTFLPKAFAYLCSVESRISSAWFSIREITDFFVPNFRATSSCVNPAPNIVNYLISRSLKSLAMRVCQPGPEAFHAARMDSGSRMVICRRGSGETGRPARLTVPRRSISSVSSGRSVYSLDLILCRSTRSRSDFKVRVDFGFFTFTCTSFRVTMETVSV